MTLRTRLLGLAALTLLACGGGASSSSSSGGSNCGDTPNMGALSGTGALKGDGQVEGAKPCSKGGDEYGAMAEAPSAAAGSSSSGSSSGGSSSGGPVHGSSSGGIQVPAGVLTAGVWDDNKNFDLFLKYRNDHQDITSRLLLTESEHRQARGLHGQLNPHQKLDVSLVIDTTGSMGDEIQYLQSEFVALSTRISQLYPGSEQHWSLVLYKDKQDDYVVKWFDFRGDTNEFKSKLSQASAGGGGDYPESSAEALDAATRLSWRDDANVAKLLFWVADAPLQAGTENLQATAIRRAASRGVHMYPVASSGVDELTELSMRGAAQVTGGRYVFLTDDSGVGEEHKVPSTPCFFVTKLNDAILRMVDIEMTGTYREPTSSEVLRKGGDPQSGVCTIDSVPYQIY